MLKLVGAAPLSVDEPLAALVPEAGGLVFDPLTVTPKPPDVDLGGTVTVAEPALLDADMSNNQTTN